MILTRVYRCNDEKNRNTEATAEHFGEVYGNEFPSEIRRHVRVRAHTYRAVNANCACV